MKCSSCDFPRWLKGQREREREIDTEIAHSQLYSVLTMWAASAVFLALSYVTAMNVLASMGAFSIVFGSTRERREETTCKHAVGHEVGFWSWVFSVPENVLQS